MWSFLVGLRLVFLLGLVMPLAVVPLHCTTEEEGLDGDGDDDDDDGDDDDGTASVTALDGLGNEIDVSDWGECLMGNLGEGATAEVDFDFNDVNPPDLEMTFSDGGLITSIDGEDCDFSDTQGPETANATFSVTCHMNFSCGDNSCRIYADSEDGQWTLSTFSEYTDQGTITWEFGPAAIYGGQGTSSGDSCGDCLDSCSGLPSCCTGVGCICEDEC